MKSMDRASKTELLGLVWDLLDEEVGGGGPARWSTEYIRALLLIDRSVVSPILEAC
jgi:hypothetical protein